jgi:hypothetical protein
VNVGIDPTGRHRLPFEIDDGGVAGCRNLSTADGAYALTFVDERGTFARLAAILSINRAFLKTTPYSLTAPATITLTRDLQVTGG